MLKRDLQNWTGCSSPALPPTTGRYVTLMPADLAQREDDLFAALGGTENDFLWEHLAVGPFKDASAFADTFKQLSESRGWLTHLICAPSGKVLGMASYMRNRPKEGSTEVGCVVFSKELQRTAAATEAIYLMAKHIFDDLGYRRFEWKCDNANEASKRAALRFGFTFEGVFRQDQVIKGRNRDTAWYAMLDHEWPSIIKGIEAWLDPSNFDAAGTQKHPLSAFMRR